MVSLFINSLRKQIRPSSFHSLSLPFAPITRAPDRNNNYPFVVERLFVSVRYASFLGKEASRPSRVGMGTYPREIRFLYGGLSDLSPTETTARSPDLFVRRQVRLGWILFPFFFHFSQPFPIRSIFLTSTDNPSNRILSRGGEGEEWKRRCVESCVLSIVHVVESRSFFTAIHNQVLDSFVQGP